MGSHLTWPHGPPVSKAFFGPFLCAKVFFWTLFVWWDAGVPFSGQVFSDLSGIVPCETYEFPFGLMGLQCRRLFLNPFCVRRFFFGPFLCGGTQVFRFLVRLFFRAFWNSPLSDVWVPI